MLSSDTGDWKDELKDKWMNRMVEWMNEILLGTYLLLYLAPEIIKLSCHAGVKIIHGYNQI